MDDTTYDPVRAARQEGMERGIYVASKTRHAPRWQALRAEGWPIISTWIDEAGPGESDFRDLWRRCIAEATSARAVLVYREPEDALKGAWIEMGAALARGVPIVAVGLREYTVAHAAGVQHADTLNEALAEILALPLPEPPADRGDNGWRHLTEMAARSEFPDLPEPVTIQIPGTSYQFRSNNGVDFYIGRATVGIECWPRHLIDHLLSELAAASALPARDDGWQPIDSAPRDGTRIWLYRPETSPDERQAVGWWHESANGGECWWMDSADSEQSSPSHWRPRPNPPGASPSPAPPAPPSGVSDEQFAAFRALVIDAVRELRGYEASWPPHGNAPLAVTSGYALLLREREALQAKVARLREALKGLIDRYIANLGTEHELIRCFAPRHASDMSSDERAAEKTWSLFDAARTALADTEGA